MFPVSLTVPLCSLLLSRYPYGLCYSLSLLHGTPMVSVTLFHCYTVPLCSLLLSRYPYGLCYSLSLLHGTPMFSVTLFHCYTVPLCSLFPSRYPYVPCYSHGTPIFSVTNFHCYTVPLCSLLLSFTVTRYPMFPVTLTVPLFSLLLSRYPYVLCYSLSLLHGNPYVPCDSVPLFQSLLSLFDLHYANVNWSSSQSNSDLVLDLKNVIKILLFQLQSYKFKENGLENGTGEKIIALLCFLLRFFMQRENFNKRCVKYFLMIGSCS